MTDSLTASKKRVVRRHILQQACDLYLHPLSDTVILANLKARFPALHAGHIRDLCGYMEQKELVSIRRRKNGLAIQITAKGVDVLDGAVKVRGVEPPSVRYTRLENKKEIRRGILAYCYSFQDYYNEDSEILAEFRNFGFSNLLMEEVRFHIWYLNQKSLINLKTFNFGGDPVFMVRVTARGMDVVEENIAEPGVSENDG